MPGSVEGNPQKQGASGASLTALTLGLVLTVMAVAFEGLAVTTIMPNVARQLGGLSTYSWAFSAFMLANVVGITAAGEQSDRRGIALPFCVGTALFGLGLGLAGAAISMPGLIVARAVQGLGGGALSSLVYACVGRVYPSERQPRMLAMLSTAWVVPGLIGPALSGLVAETIGWRFVFFGLIPPLLIAAALVLPALSRVASPVLAAHDDHRLVAAVVLAVGVVVLLLALDQQAALPGVACMVVGGILTGVGIHYVMPPGTLAARRGLPATVVTMGVVCLAFFGAETILPLLATGLRQQSAAMAGLALTAATLTWTAGSWLQSRLAETYRRRTLVAAGIVPIGVGIVCLAAVAHPSTPLAVLWISWSIVGFGMGIAHTTISLAVIEQAEPGQEGAASAAMQLAGAIGVALGAGIAGAAVLASGSTANGFGCAFALMTAAAGLGLVVARRLP